MALLFVDSCSHYATADIPAKYTSNPGGWTISPTGSFWSTGCLTNTTVNGGANLLLNQAILSSSNTLIAGFRLQIATAFPASTTNLCDFTFGTQTVSLQLTSAGILQFINPHAGGVNVVGGALMVGTWAYIEVLLTDLGTSSDVVQIRVNNKLTASNTGVFFTAPGTPNMISFYQFHNSGGVISLCDIVLLDGNGGIHNNFIGDQRVYAMLPTANGWVNTWTRSTTATAAFGLVNDVTPDGDATYVTSTTIGQEDTYALGTGLPSGASIVTAVQCTVDARKNAAGARTMALGVSNGVTNAYAVNYPALTLTYSMLTVPYDINPLTGLAWTAADISTLQAAIKVIS